MSTTEPSYIDPSDEIIDKRPCAGIREDLKNCILNSKCVTVYKKTPLECLRAKDHTAPDECSALRTTFFECKRSLLDNRTRFRGRKGY